MITEALYPDGSISTFTDSGAMHSGPAAMNRICLITAEMALRVYIATDGRMQLTANGAQKAIKNVIEPATGKKYKRSISGKKEAHADCVDLLASIEEACVVITDDN